jgi:tetratricopeptide (TPR) repeat protein
LIRLLVLALVAVAGFLAYSRVLVPLRHVRSYRRALGLLGADQHDEALPELTRLDGVLPPRQRAAARFFIAFALYRLDRLDEAEHRLAALNRENPHDVEVAYLLAYVRVGRRDFDGAEPVLAALESTGRLGAANARRLYGVVQFQRAMEAFRDGRIDAAAELFEKAEQLGDFRDQIPVDLRNRHVVLGAQALFDKDVRAARTQFEHLEQAAGRLPAGERDRTLASAKLGLALAAWIENAPGSPAAMEALLTDAAALLDPAGSLTLDWPAEATGSGLAERLAALADGGGQPAEQVELDRMLRDIHLLRGAGVLRTWADADRAEAAERADSYRADALARFACARDRDPDFSDVYLVVGLLQYYLASTGPDRASAVALLREAQKLGTRDPEVLQAINQHDRVRPENRDAVDAYLQVLDRYLQDGTVRAQVRAALVQRLAQYGKLRDWDSRQELLQVRTVAPTVAEMNDRSELLRERVRQLLAMQPGAADLAAAGDLARSLERSSQVLAEQARSVEEMEAELLGLVGDRLLANPVR